LEDYSIILTKYFGQKYFKDDEDERIIFVCDKFANYKSAFNKLLSWIKDAVDRDKDEDEDKGKGGKAVGGDISSTGMYHHPGIQIICQSSLKNQY